MLAVSLFAELSILQQFNTYIDYRYPAPSALRAAPPMGSQEDSALFVISQTLASPFGGSAEGNRGMLAVIEQCGIYRSATLSAPSGHLLPKEGGSIHASPFPWKGLPSAARRSWLPFFGGEAASSLPSPLGKALYQEKRYPRIAAFPIGEGGPRSGG